VREASGLREAGARRASICAACTACRQAPQLRLHIRPPHTSITVEEVAQQGRPLRGSPSAGSGHRRKLQAEKARGKVRAVLTAQSPSAVKAGR
jgi:hypothetical protein